MQIGKIALRGIQILLMAVVIGLSAALFKGQIQGSVPSITTWALVCGVWGAFVALVGIVAIFVEPLQRLPMLVLDSLATLFFLSGSIAMAVKLGVGSCNGGRPDGWDDNTDGQTPPNPYCATHDIISGGTIVGDPLHGEWTWTTVTNDWFVSRCQMAQADVAFLFFGLAAFAAAMVVSFLAWKRAGRK